MILRTTLGAAAAALLLSAGTAFAVPATAQMDLNVRSGPGTEYPVVGTLRAGETVDAGDCSGSWCQVSFGGGMGYASQSYLALAGAVEQGPAVAAVPYGYDDDYYGSGYTYGPALGIYAGTRYFGGNRWRDGRGHAGNWQGRGNWAGNRAGNLQGRGRWQGGNRVGNAGGFNRAAGSVRPQVSAPVSMSRGGGATIGGGAGVSAGGGAPTLGGAPGAALGRGGR